MTPRGLYRRFVSARSTVTLLALMALLLLLNVALPQEQVLGDERYAEVIESSGPVARFLLETLGLGRTATSPVFLAVLGLFFLNLTAVLLSRIGPTWRRIALRDRSEDGLRAWARMEESLGSDLPVGWVAGRVVQVLRGFGYQTRRQGERTFWGVKHRTAPLGFLLFHLSFFLLFAGGVLIYYTRFVGEVVLSEGQQFSGQYNEIHRRPPAAGEPRLAFTLEKVEARLVDGQPVHLAAVLRIQRAGSSVVKESSVNHPASWGAVSLLVEQAGLAPVLWLQDERGFTRDRVVIPARTRSAEPTVVPLAEGELTLVISPLGPEEAFPTRDRLSETSLTIELLDEEASRGRRALRAGQSLSWDGGRLVLEEIRYWANLKVISERGGGLLIAGFLAGTLGLIWRLLWYRREVAVTWDDEVFRLVGRSEYFSDRFRQELKGIFAMLERGEAGVPSGERQATTKSSEGSP